MKKGIFLIIPIALFLINASCTKDIDRPISTDVLYSNSFESPLDTASWGGCWLSLIDDTPSGGGAKALSVSCGCLAPHVNFDIGPFTEDHKLIISCMARGHGMGGFLSLRQGIDEINFGISADISEWTYQQSPDTLFCSANETLSIYISAGGFASGTVDIDLLEIRAVD